jgi:hypothetical protein
MKSQERGDRWNRTTTESFANFRNTVMLCHQPLFHLKERVTHLPGIKSKKVINLEIEREKDLAFFRHLVFNSPKKPIRDF